MKRSTVLPLSLLVWGVMLCTSVAQAERDMPQVLYSTETDSSYPLWIAAEAAFDQHGEVITDLCDPGSCIFLKSLAATPPDPVSGCIEREEADELLWDPPDRSTLEKSVKSSQLVLFAEVEDTAFGFMGGVPGQLIRVEPKRDFKGERLLDGYFFFFPAGNFVAGPYEICKIDRSYPAIPTVGDEVLLMVPYKIDSNEPFLAISGGEGVVVVRKNPDVEAGVEVDFPRSFQALAETIRGKEELTKAVERALRGEG